MLASVGVAVGSGAAFTSQSSNPSNAFASGALTMSNSKNNAAILSAANMLPGGSTQGNVDIYNTSTVPATMTLTRTALNDSDGANPLSAKLNLVVKDCGNFSAGMPVCNGASPVKYTGTLAAMTATTALGTFAADEKRRYEFTVTFDSSADNVYQRDRSAATFQRNGAE